MAQQLLRAVRGWVRAGNGSPAEYKDQNCRIPPFLLSPASSCPLNLTFGNFQEEKMPQLRGCRGLRTEGELTLPVRLAMGVDCELVVCYGLRASPIFLEGLLFLTSENLDSLQGPELSVFVWPLWLLLRLWGCRPESPPRVREVGRSLASSFCPEAGLLQPHLC